MAVTDGIVVLEWLSRNMGLGLAGAALALWRGWIVMGSQYTLVLSRLERAERVLDVLTGVAEKAVRL